jgi:2-methylisocitrate lyase-like PEP mutase family enzyme
LNGAEEDMMRPTVVEKREAFAALHRSGCFVIPNPWDVGSARLLEHLGFPALATTSTGFAWTAGRPDYAVERADVLQHLATLCAASDLPINADFESGFGETPKAVADSVRLAIEAGVAGLSVEDRIVGDLDRLYPTEAAVERMLAARAAIDASGETVLLVGRTEGLLMGGDVRTAIDKLVALADAGADCLYAPGLTQAADIKALVAAVAPRPVNVLALGPNLSLTALADLGVRRVSIGGALARIGWAAVKAAAEDIRAGDFAGLGAGLPGRDLNAIFAARD